MDQAGGLSPYGVMGLGGNAFEWDENDGNLVNDFPNGGRGLRGGTWYSGSYFLSSSSRIDFNASYEDDSYGFRVASVTPSAPVPEPSMMVIGTLFGLGGLVAKRRMRK